MRFRAHITNQITRKTGKLKTEHRVGIHNQMITIKVDVIAGVAPVPIKVYIDNLDNDHDIHFSKPGSFKSSYKLEPGRYSVIIGGMNNVDTDRNEDDEIKKEPRTEITVTGNCSVGPIPEETQYMTTKFYSSFFYLEVK